MLPTPKPAPKMSDDSEPKYVFAGFLSHTIDPYVSAQWKQRGSKKSEEIPITDGKITITPPESNLQK